MRVANLFITKYNSSEILTFDIKFRSQKIEAPNNFNFQLLSFNRSILYNSNKLTCYLYKTYLCKIRYIIEILWIIGKLNLAQNFYYLEFLDNLIYISFPVSILFSSQYFTDILGSISSRHNLFNQSDLYFAIHDKQT